MSKQLLIEYIAFKPSPQSLKEGIRQTSKNLVVEGLVQRAEAKNQNGRVYQRVSPAARSARSRTYPSAPATTRWINQSTGIYPDA